MSDLAGGAAGPRATNGGARVQGPVPVTQAERKPARSQLLTPRDIIRRREERMAQAEANARATQEAERAAAAGSSQQQPQTQQPTGQSTSQRRASGGGAARTSDEQSYPTYTRPPQPQAGPSVADAAVSSPQPQPRPPGESSQYQPRASSQSQGQPRPAQSSAGVPQNASSRPPAQPIQPAVAGPSQARPTQPATSSSTTRPAGPIGTDFGHKPTASGGTTSSFPHAFERWETLSSHWEGLTSYWIRKLEQNPEELQRQPLLNQLSRQVTDLSAAGANLFHAVVELQRLRASSERKFQRWFYESQKDKERQQEITATLESALNEERQARAKDMERLQSEIDRVQRSERQAKTLASEIKRELQISKDEARRAWEELGRREQEERDRTAALNDGHPIVVGGVQVFPTLKQPGEEILQAFDPQVQGTEGAQVYEGGESPTNTDPFIESVPRHTLHHEPPNIGSAAQRPYAPESAFARSDSSARTAIQISTSEPYGASSGPYQPGPSTVPVSGAEPFYQHGNTYLHNSGQAVSGASDEQSYVPSEEGFTEEEEYEVDRYGNVLPRRGLRSEGSDEEDVGEQIEHEAQLRQQYGGASGRPIVDYPVIPPLASGSSAPPPVPTIPTSYAAEAAESAARRRPPVPTTVATTAATAAAAAATTPAASLTPDYAGDGYGSPTDRDSRHYYPTRLSDVPEEDERSRVSEATQGGTSSA